MKPLAVYADVEALRNYFVRQTQNVIVWQETGGSINVIVEGRSK